MPRHHIFVEYFLDALIERPFLQDLLEPREYETVATFMRDSILDRLDQERELFFSARASASPALWFEALNAFTVIFPLLERLWNEWWSMKTLGHAVAVLQYLACLLYLNDDNPLFAPWTPQVGGGPPALWETGALVDRKGWRRENVSFLRATLTGAFVEGKVKQAAAFLQGQVVAPVAERMVRDFESHRDILAYHLDVLPTLLASWNLTSSEKSLQWE